MIGCIDGDVEAFCEDSLNVRFSNFTNYFS